MAEDQVEEIKRKVDIVEIVGEHVKLAHSGRNFKALCPFHSEKTPSFMVSPDLQIFKCFGCGLGGDVYTFLQEYEKVEFPQALKILADRVGVKLRPLTGQPDFAAKDEIYRANSLAAEFYHYLLTGHPVGRPGLEYLRKRGLKDESIKAFKLGFAPDRPDAAFKFLAQKKGYKPEVLEKAGLVIKKETSYFDRFRARLIFPLHDAHANVLGFAGRVIQEQGDLAKYINTPDTLVYKKGRVLYGLHLTKNEIKERDRALVVEGEFDAISSWQVGVKNVVAIKGSALTEEQARLLLRYSENIVLATDADLAGWEAARRAIEVLQKTNALTRVVQVHGFKDPDEAAQKDPAGWREAVSGAQDIYDFLIDFAFGRFDNQTNEGKAKISRELSPVLASVSDEILQAHLLKKVAGRLGVPEEAVYRQTQKQPRTEVATGMAPSLGPTKSRREILEEYLLTLAFQGEPQILADEAVRGLLQSPACQRLAQEWQKWAKDKKSFDPSQFANQLPGELVEFFAQLILKEAAVPQDPETLAREKEKVIKEIKTLGIKEEMARLRDKIKNLEQEKKATQLTRAEEELVRTGNKLAALEVG